MSLLIHLDRFARSGKSEDEGFLNAVLAEFLNRDEDALAACLDLFGLPPVAACSAFTQYGLWNDDGTWVGEADVYLHPHGAGRPMVVECKTRSSLGKAQLEKYAASAGGPEVVVLVEAGSLDKVPKGWRARS